MKRALVAALIRLYPWRWRAEYGGELATLLLDRPFGARVALNVVANAVWQQLRMGEPWLIVGLPLFLWGSAAWIGFLLFPHAPAFAPPLNFFTGLLMSLGVGFWTSRRLRAGGGGRAVLKLMLMLHAPVFVVGLLTLVGAAHAIWDQHGIHLRLAGPGPGERELADAFAMILRNNSKTICLMSLMGWLGGQAGRLSRRLV